MSNIILFMKASGISDILSFGYIDPPHRSSIVSALASLHSLGALDKCGNITELGKKMSLFPLDPFLSRTILAAGDLQCAEQVLSIVALLSVENLVFKSKKELSVEVDSGDSYEPISSLDTEQNVPALIDFYHPRGDHLTLLNIYESYAKATDKKTWFSSHPSINRKSFVMALRTREQLWGFCKKASITTSSNAADSETILKAFIEGFSSNISVLTLPSKRYKGLSSNQVF